MILDIVAVNQLKTWVAQEFNIPIQPKEIKNMRLNSCYSIFAICMETAIS